jgi:hypothetical protein
MKIMDHLCPKKAMMSHVQAGVYRITLLSLYGICDTPEREAADHPWALTSSGT